MALAFILLALLASPAFAQTFPPLTGRVVDNANLLSPAQEAELSAKLEALEKSTGRQLVVATLPDLQGYEIEDYGYQLGRAWGIGQKGQNNGIILIVAPNQRKVRIEVGYGLEPYVTDALSSTIIQEQILPKFKANDYPGGIEAGVDALLAQLRLPEDQAQARQTQILAQDEQKQGTRHRGGGIPIGLIFWLFVLGFVILSHRRRKGPWGARRYNRGSNWPVWLWAASEIADSASRGSRGGSSWGGGDWGGGGGGGGFSGGGGSFGGGGASGSW